MSELLPLIRKNVGGFLYPYGSYPDDNYEQLEGYETDFFAPGAQDSVGDRHRTVVMVSAEKVIPVFMDLCQLLPTRVQVILERASEDVYTDRDVFTTKAEVEREQFIEVFKAYEFVFAEDGMLGIGAYGEDEPVEIFLADHKEILVFSPTQAPVTEILKKHGVPSRRLNFYYEAAHNHTALTEYRGLSETQFDFMHVADAVRHVFDMSLQCDEDENVDSDGNVLGMVPWRAIVLLSELKSKVRGVEPRQFLQDFCLSAATRREAEELLHERVTQRGYDMDCLDELFRIDLSMLPTSVRPGSDDLIEANIWYSGDLREMEIPWH